MTEYPKYIIDEVERRLTDSLFQGADGVGVDFDCNIASHRAIADLLLESGFKPPVDPLLEDVWFCAAYADRNEEDFEGFRDRLFDKGLTVTVTKTGDA